MGTGSSTEADHSILDPSLDRAKSMCLYQVRHGFLGLVGIGTHESSGTPVFRVYSTKDEPVSFPLDGIEPKEFMGRVIEHIKPNLTDLDYTIIRDPLDRPSYLMVLHNIRGIILDITLNGMYRYSINVGDRWVELSGAAQYNKTGIQEARKLLEALEKGANENFGRPRATPEA